MLAFLWSSYILPDIIQNITNLLNYQFIPNNKAQLLVK